MHRFTDSEFLTFVSLMLGVSLAMLLQFAGRIAANWHRLERPWTTVIWVATAAVCHADYWCRMSRLVHDDVTTRYFYFELAFPSLLVVASSILASVDLVDKPKDRDFIDLHEQYIKIALPFFSLLVLLMVVGWIDGALMFKEGWISLPFSCRLAGAIVCIALLLKKSNYRIALCGATVGLCLYIVFIAVAA